MFRKVSSLALAICALGGGMILAEPAIADGWWGRGSIKDRVPVPAPVPIPDHAARWYLRADLGLGFASADPSESGIVYGHNLYGPPPDTPTPFGTPSKWSNDDPESMITYGAGIGYYWYPFFRTDLTVEGRSARNLRIRGTYQYDQYDYDYGEGEWVENANQVDGDTRDDGKLNSGLVLFNAYFDFLRSGPLTPYFGAGLGFAVNKLERNFSNREAVCDPSNLGPWQDNCLDTGAPYQRSARDSTYDVTLAAALMAGLTYSISPVTMLDLNYRYLYIGSSNISLNIGNANSNFSTGDTHEHQIRVGLRWNIQ